MRIPLLTLLSLAPAVVAADPVRLVEKAAPGSEYRVYAASNIGGELLIPVAKDKPPDRVKITGRSVIEYAEKVLAVDPKEADHKGLRAYERIDFKKTTQDRTDEATLRPAVRRLVVMKKGPKKAPFSPDGPLMYDEIDLIRTDLVVPALAGLLPDREVKPGDTWAAGEAAVVELTDLEKVDKGELTCVLDRVLALGPRKVAQVSFAGTLQGVSEDGPVRHRLSGRLEVDLGAECITFLKVDGERTLLDEAGKDAGKVTGTFELTRARQTGHKALAEAALAGLDLTPSEENTRLLYDSEETGVRFVHPRNWKVVRSTGRQITLDESGGTGLLITLDTAEGVPTAARFLREAKKELQDRGARLTNSAGPERLADGVDRFTLDTEVGKEKVTMDYVVIRQDKGGATLAARMPAADREARMKELERLARSFVVTRRLDGK